MTAIIDYGAGNTGSLLAALERMGQDCILTNDAAQLCNADKIILPGVGEAASAMSRLHSLELVSLIRNLTQPVLGICLGLQLLCRHSEEGNTPCLDIIDTDVRRFPEGHIVPHMGWNNIEPCESKIFPNLPAAPDLYFVHSYYAPVCKYTTSVCRYILPFSATLQYKNFYATQFHPEKSGSAGEQIIQNFLSL